MFAISLFSNCGAGDVGFQQAGFSFVVLAEIRKNRLDVALLNHPKATGVLGDLRSSWPRVVEAWKSKFKLNAPDLLVACPPCQGMSTAKRDRGADIDAHSGTSDERNLLVLPIARTVSALNPAVVVVENVRAFLTRLVVDPSTNYPISAAHLLIKQLESRYVVFPFVTDLADYGIPQSRKRAFLTFVRRGTCIFKHLASSGSVPYPVPTNATDHGGSPIRLASALSEFGLCPLDSRSSNVAKDPTNPLHFVPVWRERQRRMVAAIPPGSGLSAWDNNECERCGIVESAPDDSNCQLCGGTLLRPVIVKNGKTRLVHGFRRSSYRRMNPNAPAATITTASGRIGSNRTIHPFENRVLSPLECSLLQTIPNNFKWGIGETCKSSSELRSMIGEAVPPRFTFLHGRVLHSLLGRPESETRLVSPHDIRYRKAIGRLASIA